MYRFLNNQAIQVFHMRNAITDGDSAVWFRRSDVIAAGDVYNSDIYPPIDVDRGGSIDGEIDALGRLLELCVTDFMSQGGTMIIPGHGWISDAADVGYYRDMVMIIRDRVQAMIDKGMTAGAGQGRQADDGFRPGIRQGARRDRALRGGRLSEPEGEEDP